MPLRDFMLPADRRAVLWHLGSVLLLSGALLVVPLAVAVVTGDLPRTGTFAAIEARKDAHEGHHRRASRSTPTRSAARWRRSGHRDHHARDGGCGSRSGGTARIRRGQPFESCGGPSAPGRCDDRRCPGRRGHRRPRPPSGALAVAVQHGKATTVAHGSLRLSVGDVVLVLAQGEDVLRKVQRAFR